jgi:hypothetical protein
VVEEDHVSRCSDHDDCVRVAVSAMVSTGIAGDWHFQAHPNDDHPNWSVSGPNGQSYVLPVTADSGSVEPLINSVPGAMLHPVAVKIASMVWPGWPS